MAIPPGSDLWKRLKHARRKRGLTQAAVARAVGSSQSAISQAERLELTLGEDKARAVASLLGVDPDESTPAAETPTEAWFRFCSDPDCTSNIPHVIGNRVVLTPRPVASNPTETTRCVECGEVLEESCPECSAPVRKGSHCVECGSPYIVTKPSWLPKDPADLRAAASERRQEIREIRDLATPEHVRQHRGA